MAGFSEAVLDHFRSPRNSGELSSATHRVEVSNPVCGDVLQLAAHIEGGRIREIRFMCRGCTTAIACASWAAEFLTEKTLHEAKGLTTEIISKGLGELPEETKHGAMLAADAVRALLRETR